ncbi:MAG: ATP-binding protein [Candidatus Poribacteria bacterium]|nr:ATP-binding protein [Candidatus Poribacteria bacterium]
MKTKMPFSQKELNLIFKTTRANPDRVVSRESSRLEFKESFGWASLSKYLKTSAAYANTKGGYIVFGIANRPHYLCGLSGTSLVKFEDIDPEKMSHNFNNHFSPEIEWSIHNHEFYGMKFGLLYIYQTKDKPVICTKDAGKELKEGDIYYRYRGRTERIKYPELRAMLESKREAEQRLWMQHLKSIAHIGVRDAGIFNLHTGSVTGPGGSFLIDESLLSDLSFIKEGEFSEVKGKQTIKLIGHVETLPGTVFSSNKKQVLKVKGIRTPDIVLSALNEKDVLEPAEYIRQICFESTGFLPVYYFIKKSGMTLDKIIEVLESVVSRSISRKKLIERLRSRNTQEIILSHLSTPASIKKRKYAESLRNKKVSRDLSGKELVYCLQAIRGLTVDEIISNSRFIRGLLRHWFNKHYTSANGPLADNLRRSICWIDEALNMGDCR